MGLGGILILLLLLVSLIVFIYVLVISARGWGVLHSILLSCLFIEAWVLIVFSAGVHYRRVNATEEAHKNREAAEQALATTQQLMWGDFGTSPDALDAVVPVQGKLRRLTADRGRVWRQASLVQADQGSYQLALSARDLRPQAEEVDPLAEDPAAAAAAAGPPSSESLPVNTVVYAFAENLNEAGQPVPVYYLGEFVVKESQGGQVTLAPTLPLYADQQQRIDAGAANWTLYELLPQDSHQTFAAAGSEPSDEQIFGRMDEETIRSLFANVPADDNRQEQLVNAYLRDGQRATDSDPSDQVWVQVNVLKEYELDVDSKEVANATERGFFDALGRSIDSRLKVGEGGTVKLTPDMKGQRIILKEEVATPLIANGVLELVQRVYVRPLIDFEEAFNHHYARDHEVTESIALFQRDSEEINKANQYGQEMISFRQVEKQKLQSDVDNFQREVSVLTEAVEQASTQLSELKAQIREMYQNIQARHAELVSSRTGG